MKKENMAWIVMLLVAVLAIGTWLNSGSEDAGTTTEAETETSVTLENGET